MLLYIIYDIQSYMKEDEKMIQIIIWIRYIDIHIKFSKDKDIIKDIKAESIYIIYAMYSYMARYKRAKREDKVRVEQGYYMV